MTSGGIDLDEAARQLELAVHDAQVAYDCLGLGNVDRAHTYAITARAAVDAAENVLRAALNANDSPSDE
jgi:hypothetical protein